MFQMCIRDRYHRDYQEREPVEITIEPDKISILSYSGPDRSVTIEAIRKGELLRSRRYRNRRLGDFLKELDLTEGRSTGIPTIQDELRRNGSPKAIIETDPDRTYFMIDIPCREGVETTSIAKGVGIGTSAHAVGTSKALQMGEVEGAMSLSLIHISRRNPPTVQRGCPPAAPADCPD